MPHALRQLLVLVVVVAGGLTLWRWVARVEEPPPAPPRVQGPVRVQTEEVRLVALARRFEVFGTLEPVRTLDVTAEVAGRLRDVHPEWRPGGEVAADELLFALDDRPLALTVAARRADTEDARARVRAAKSEQERAGRAVERLAERRTVAVREHERVADLVGDGVVSQSSVDQALSARIAAEWEEEQSRTVLDAAGAQLAAAEARLASANAALALAEDQQARTLLRAPFAGTFVGRGPEPGTLVAPGQILGELVELDALRFTARVPADELLHLREGLAVTVHLAGRPEVVPPFALQGELRALGPRVDPETRHGVVEIEVDNPLAAALTEGDRPPRLPAGLFARAVLELDPRDELWIAREHFAWRAGKPTAFVLQDGRALARALVFAREHEEGFTLAGGLQPGELLITEPLERLVDGTPARDAGEEPAGAQR